MKGRDRFTSGEADEIRRVLRLVRKAQPGAPQKLLRDQLRAVGFYISDFGGGPVGFTATEFDELVRSGRIRITDGHASRKTATPRSPTAARPPARPASTGGSSPAESAAKTGAGTPVALTALCSEPMSIKAATGGGVPNVPGLYALYGSPAGWRALGLGSPPDDRPLYVGKAEASLVSRDLKTHFATGKTGWSSPRRSFAALLSAAGVLELVPMPRRPGNPEPTKWTHYGLEDPGDGQLTDWMCSKLRIAVWPSPPGTVLKAVETEVMGYLLPPLNLIGVSTPWTGQVRTARAMMARQAREWARKRGFDV